MAFQVNDLPSKEISSGNGVQTVFSFNFDLFSIDTDGVLDGNDVFATVDNITLTKVSSNPTSTEFTVDTVLKQITFGAAPSNNVGNVTIFRQTAKERQQGYQTSAEIASDTLNRDINRLWSVVQEQDEEVTRTLRVPITSSLLDLQVPEPIALNLLQWDATASFLENISAASLGSPSFPITIAQGGTGSTTASDARIALGSSVVGDALFITTDASAARITLGSGTTGDLLFTSATASSARTTLGSGTTGDALFISATASSARTTLGSTAVGDAIFISPSASSARTTLGSGTTGCFIHICYCK